MNLKYNARKFIIINGIILFFIFHSVLSAQISVVIPDTTTIYDYPFSLPLRLLGYDHLDSLIAYQLTLTYDTTRVEVEQISSIGTFTENWADPYVNIIDGEIHVAAFSTQPIPAGPVTNDTLLILSMRIINDDVFTTNIEFDNFLMFVSTGIVPVQSLVGSSIQVINNDPPVVSGIPIFPIPEDSTSMLELASYIHDNNHSLSELVTSVASLSSHLVVTGFDSLQQYLYVTPEENWTGTGEMVLKATDPYGIWDSDTFQVVVYQLPDPPGPFKLIAPSHDTTLTNYDYISFEWEAPLNVDAGDIIHYNFYLGKDSTFQTNLVVYIPSLSYENHNLILYQQLFDDVYYWGVKAYDSQGLETWCDTIFRLNIQTDVAINDPNLPVHFSLSQNYPNPFNPITVIHYQSPKAIKVKLEIFDALGHHVRTLLDSYISAGEHTLQWDGKDKNQHFSSSGIYFLRMTAGDFIQQRKMILLH